MFGAGDLITILDQTATTFDRLGALVDFFATIGNSIIPLIGGRLGGDIAVWANKVAGVIMGALSMAQVALAWVKEGSWWKREGADAVLKILTSGLGPIAMFEQVLWTMAKPVVGNLLDMGGHFFQAAGFSDQAEITRQENMSEQDWCAQYGGCPSLASYTG